MFNQARLKLTFAYLLILFCITGLFSFAFYQGSTRELQRIIFRLENRNSRYQLDDSYRANRPPELPSLADLKTMQQRSLYTLLVVNGGILSIAGILSYILAGKTMLPIKVMLEKQSNFVSNASHELRTPLAIMRAEIESTLLQKIISDKQARDLLTSNLEEISRLQQLTDSLLELTQQKKKERASNSEVTLNQCVAEAINKIQPLAASKQITISTNDDAAMVLGDKSHITELVLIVLDNAVKFSPRDASISVQISQKSDESIVTIADAGIGISKKDLPHIFERLYRGDASRSQTSGFGLGLSIAQEIIQVHGGYITVVSNKRKGSTFTLHFPAA